VKYDPKMHHRRSIRLKGYDYTKDGLYFITICTLNHIHLFGKINNGIMALNEVGQVAAEALQWLPGNYQYVEVAESMIMPNHLHAIIEIGSCRGGSQTTLTQTGPTKRKPLGRLVGSFKTVSSRRINEMRQMPGCPVWQRNYYEHIIRDHESYVKCCEYIRNNPLKWQEDKYYG